MKKIILVLLTALIFRFILSPLTFHVDLFSFAGWGERLYKEGTIGFYQSKNWLYSEPSQPPLVHLIYGFNYYLFEQKFLWILSYSAAVITTHNFYPSFFSPLFNLLNWFNSLHGETPYRWGYVLTIKLIPILADILIGLIIYLLAKKVTTIKKALVLSSIYLFIPYSFYISGLWGQYDQVSFLFLLLAFLSLLNKRLLVLSPLLLIISLSLKPTSLAFIPLFLWVYILQKPNIIKITLGWGLAAASLVYSISLFTNQNILEFSNNILLSKIFEKGDLRVVNNAFNFWKIFIGENLVSQNQVFMILPYKVWGYLIFGLLNLWSFIIIRKKSRSLENIFTGMFLVGAGSFFILTNILERYLFAGITSLLFLTIYKPHLLKYFLMMSFIFWINLFKGWWYPELFSFLRAILTWQESIVVRVLSLINVIIFIKILKNLR